MPLGAEFVEGRFTLGFDKLSQNGIPEIIRAGSVGEGDSITPLVLKDEIASKVVFASLKNISKFRVTAVNRNGK